MDSKRLLKVLKKAGAAADRHGLNAYAVGGYVRDQVIGLSTKDIDIVVLEPEGGIRLAQALRREYGFGKPVLFPRFQTAQTRYKGVAVELVAARKEAYRKGSRKPAKVGLATLKEDIARRDFTVNSLVMGLNKNNFGKISDHTRQGRADIRRKVIRCIGAPAARFSEDPLRMLRAIRFACQLQFSLEPSVIQAIKKKKKRLSIISVERVREELEKILMSPVPADGIRLLTETGLLKIIDPELARMQGFEQDSVYHDQDLLEHTLAVLSRSKRKLTVRLAILYHDTGKLHTKRKKEDRFVYYDHERKSRKIAAGSLRRLKFPNQVIEDACFLIGAHMINYSPEWTDAAVRRLIHKSGPYLTDLLSIRRADMLSLAPPYNKKRIVSELGGRVRQLNAAAVQKTTSPLDGHQIQELLQIEPGRKIGEIKKRIVEAILNGEIKNTRDAAKKLVKKEFIPD